MNNFDKKFELFCLKDDFDVLYKYVLSKSRDLAGHMNSYYNTINEVVKLFSYYEEQITRDTNRIIRLKQELYKSNKNSNKYYSALKKINEICAKNSCTVNSEYLSDLLYDIEMSVTDALSDNHTTLEGNIYKGERRNKD